MNILRYTHLGVCDTYLIIWPNCYVLQSLQMLMSVLHHLVYIMVHVLTWKETLTVVVLLDGMEIFVKQVGYTFESFWYVCIK